MRQPYASAYDVRFAESICSTPGIARSIWHAWAVRVSFWQLSRCLELGEADHYALFRDMNDWLRKQRWER